MEEGKSSTRVVSVGREEGRGGVARRLCGNRGGVARRLRGKKGMCCFIGTQWLLHHMELYFWLQAWSPTGHVYHCLGKRCPLRL